MPNKDFRIRSIVAAPLLGESPKGGWSHEIKPEESVHALIAVLTHGGLTGYGSVFTSGGLVEAALKVLEPLYAGENALEPERVSEKLHQNTFWMAGANDDAATWHYDLRRVDLGLAIAACDHVA